MKEKIINEIKHKQEVHIYNMLKHFNKLNKVIEDAQKVAFNKTPIPKSISHLIKYKNGIIIANCFDLLS